MPGMLDTSITTVPRDQTSVTQVSSADASSSRRVSSSRGTGKVLPRKGAKSSPSSLTPKLTRFCHEDVENGESDQFPRPRFLSRLRSAWVACKVADHTGSLQQARGLLHKGVPVKLTKTPLVLKILHWTPDHVAQLMEQQHEWEVLCSLQKHNLFIEAAADKNVFGSYYHVREPQTQQLQMTFGEYAQCASRWTTKKVMFNNTIMQGDVQQHIPAPVPHIAGLSQELQNNISWEWLQALQKLVMFGSIGKVTLQAASCDSLCPAQYQTHERLLAQVTGCQRLLLIPPDYAFKGMYPYPLHHPYDGYSMVDLEQADLAQWPKNADVKGLCCIVKPGDVVYLPAYWFVHAQCLEASNISLTFHMAAGMRARPAACVPLQLSRHLEARVADLEGVANVRHWLRLTGYCEEEEWIDLATVKGYRRIVMCQEIRDELMLHLATDGAGADEAGEGELQDWQKVVIAMCEGRLLPTPWLNKDFREPLYLTDTTTQHKDTRSAEEQKYPQLFRHKLKAQGWSVPESNNTIPIPGYNT